MSGDRPQPPSQRELRRAAEFRLALRHFHAATERIVSAHGLTSRQYLLLLVLESLPDKSMTVGELAHRFELAPSTMSELLDRAEQAGVLNRVEAVDDGRVYDVHATSEGRRRLACCFDELAKERRALARVALPLLEPDRAEL